jgi:hypothetical protein
MEDAMFEVQVFVPVADNNGVAFEEADYAALETEIATRFGGFTLNPGAAVGAWIDGGRIYHDRHRIYSIGVRSLTQGHLIGEVLGFAKNRFRQEAIFFRYLGQTETF